MSLKLNRETDTQDDIVGYIDSNFAESKTDRKSTRGYVFMLARVAISHSSKLQSIVALSTCETKYVTICEAGKKVVWLGYSLTELGFWEKSTPITLYADN